MTAKVEIVKRLGEQAVLLPSLIAEALNANDRIKLTPDHATGGDGACIVGGSAAPSLQAERHAAGLSDPQFDRIITGARRLDGDRIAIPGVTPATGGHSRRYGDYAGANRGSRIRNAVNPYRRGSPTCKSRFRLLQTA